MEHFPPSNQNTTDYYCERSVDLTSGSMATSYIRCKTLWPRQLSDVEMPDTNARVLRHGTARRSEAVMGEFAMLHNGVGSSAVKLSFHELRVCSGNISMG